MTTDLVLALTIGGLFGCGVYLMLSRNLIRVILGFLLAGHGVNLMLLSVGGGFVPPIVGEPTNGQEVADPIPQALILTSIVITLAVATFLFAMAYRNYILTRDPEIDDEPEPDELADAELGAGEE
jgi:multicomponent Na+:H+ antiporter subunit C